MRENMDQKNSEYEHLSRIKSEKLFNPLLSDVHFKYVWPFNRLQALKG